MRPVVVASTQLGPRVSVLDRAMERGICATKRAITLDKLMSLEDSEGGGSEGESVKETADSDGDGDGDDDSDDDHCVVEFPFHTRATKPENNLLFTLRRGSDARSILKISNTSSTEPAVFIVQATKPKLYQVMPAQGVLGPHSKIDVVVVLEKDVVVQIRERRKQDEDKLKDGVQDEDKLKLSFCAITHGEFEATSTGNQQVTVNQLLRKGQLTSVKRHCEFSPFEMGKNTAVEGRGAQSAGGARKQGGMEKHIKMAIREVVEDADCERHDNASEAPLNYMALKGKLQQRIGRVSCCTTR
jgi:hypothetical protein